MFVMLKKIIKNIISIGKGMTMKKYSRKIDPFENEKEKKKNYTCEVLEGGIPCAFHAPVQLKTGYGPKHVCHAHYEQFRQKTDLDRELEKRIEMVKSAGKIPSGSERLDYIQNFIEELATAGRK